MAILYYPKDSVIARVNAWNPNYEQTVIGVNPNMVFYFDTGSGINAASASMLAITASWALTASISTVLNSSSVSDFSTSSSFSVSSSYAATASVALNAVGAGNASAYSTIFTSSTNWITCSFSDASTQIVNITQSGSYSFTASNIPQPGNSQSADILVYVNNTAIFTSSLNFPSTWINVGSSWPTSITASKNMAIWLKAFDNSTIIGTANAQL